MSAIEVTWDEYPEDLAKSNNDLLGYSDHGIGNRRMLKLLKKKEKQRQAEKAQDEAIAFAFTPDDQDPLWKVVLNYCDPRSAILGNSSVDDAVVVAAEDAPPQTTTTASPMSELNQPQEWQRSYSMNGVGNPRMRSLLMENEDQERVRKAHEEALMFACTVDDQDPLCGYFMNYCDPRSLVLLNRGNDNATTTKDNTNGDQDAATVVTMSTSPDLDPMSDTMQEIDSLLVGCVQPAAMETEEHHRTSHSSQHLDSRLSESEEPSRELAALEIGDDYDTKEEDISTPRSCSRDMSYYHYDDEDAESIRIAPAMNSLPVGGGAKASASVEVIYDQPADDMDEGRRCTLWGLEPMRSIAEETKYDIDEGRRCSLWGTAPMPSIAEETKYDIDEGRRCTTWGKTPPSIHELGTNQFVSPQDQQRSWEGIGGGGGDNGHDDADHAEASSSNQSLTKGSQGGVAKASTSIEVIYDGEHVAADEGRRCTVWGKS